MKRPKRKQTKRPKSTAYPELVEHNGEQWTVHSDGSVPRVEYEGKRMFVPLETEARARMIRQHEETHLALDDRKLIDEALARGTIDLQALNAIADVRVNAFAQERCGYWTETVMTPEMLEAFAKKCEAGEVTDEIAAGMMAASHGTPDDPQIREAVYPVLGPDKYGRVQEITRYLNARSTDDEILEAAEALTELFNDEKSSDEKSSDDGDGKSKRSETRTEVTDDSDPFDELPDVPPVRDTYAERGTGKWGTMTVNRAPLTQRLPVRLRGRGKRAVDCGAVAANPHRAITDQRIFKGTGRSIGASVLIDISGSMRLETDDVIALMRKYPAGVIAVYSGYQDAGQLWIVANKGRMCAPIHITKAALGGNIVDGPALDWLATQKQPRYWICDGIVTGVGDCQYQNLIDEAAQKTKRGRIKRIDPAQFKKFLKKRGR